MTEPATQYHLCHLNIGPAQALLTDPRMAGFVERLDAVNQLAYQSPGFVWHLKIDIHNPEHLAMYGVPGLLFNLSVWESVEALSAYVYRGGHLEAMKHRREWFGEMSGPNYALWWILAGQLPTLEEGKMRIARLGEQGPTEYAFTFKHPFPPPDAASAAATGPVPIAAPRSPSRSDVSDSESSNPLSNLEDTSDAPTHANDRPSDLPRALPAG
jgi:hypothetical protein